MSDLTVHTGLQGDDLALHVEWFDENNVHQCTTIKISVLMRDKPRTLAISVNGVLLAQVERR